METFKSIITSVIIFGIIAVGGYWAVTTIEPGGVHIVRQSQKKIEDSIKKLEKELEQVKSELNLLTTRYEEQTQIILDNNQELLNPSDNKTEQTNTGSQNQELINALQKLVDDNVLMKSGSRGSRVGTVQQFLNIYNNANRKIDNDYGLTTKNLIIQFQKDQGLTQDGEAGPSTFRKMISWF